MGGGGGAGRRKQTAGGRWKVTGEKKGREGSGGPAGTAGLLGGEGREAASRGDGAAVGGKGAGTHGLSLHPPTPGHPIQPPEKLFSARIRGLPLCLRENAWNPMTTPCENLYVG